MTAAMIAPSPRTSGTTSPTYGVQRPGPNATMTAVTSKTIGPAKLG